MTVYAAHCARCGEWKRTAVTVATSTGVSPYCQSCADEMGFGKKRR